MPTKAAASASAAIRTRTTARGRPNAYESNSSYPLLCTKCPKEVNAGRRGILSLRPRHVANVIEPHVIGALAERGLRNQQREVQPERSDRPETAPDCGNTPVDSDCDRARRPCEPADHVRRHAASAAIDIQEAAGPPEANGQLTRA